VKSLSPVLPSAALYVVSSSFSPPVDRFDLLLQGPSPAQRLAPI
jgi:hypothetical protein